MTGVLTAGLALSIAIAVFGYSLYLGWRERLFHSKAWYLLSGGSLLVCTGLICSASLSWSGDNLITVVGIVACTTGALWWFHESLCLRKTYLQLREAHMFLDARVREHTKELKSTQEKLVQSAQLASLGQMSAGLAHEINQPLGIIQLNTELTRRMLDDKQVDRAMVSKLQQESQTQCRRIIKIVRHLRVFSRDGELSPRDHHDMNGMVAEAFVLFSEELRINGIEATKDLAADLPLAVCNQVQVVQVLTNLISNARDAVENEEHKRIEVRTFAQGDFVCVAVEDNGCGIPRDVLNRIYDPFFTTKEVGKGTGLGMSISYGIVQEHGGDLKVKTREGEGTCFTVLLPAVKSQLDELPSLDKLTEVGI